MADPFIGEIILVGFNFAPQGYAFCQGQLMAISQNDALFALIGTTYGGDGEQTFALPDLRGRAPIHMGQGTGLSNYFIGEMAGTETTTLLTTQIPSHTHAIDRSGLTAVARGVGGNGNQVSAVNALPSAAPFGFADDPVVAGQTPVKAAHVIELRQRVDDYRLSVGLAAFPYGDPVLTPPTTPIKAQHLLDLRTALTQAYVKAGLVPPGFDPNLAAGQGIKAVHVNELRTALSVATGGAPRYSASADATMAAGAITIGGSAVAATSGGSQPHENMQPYLAMNYCICLEGIFPSQS